MNTQHNATVTKVAHEYYNLFGSSRVGIESFLWVAKKWAEINPNSGLQFFTSCLMLQVEELAASRENMLGAAN
jgi:hypothetical protein